MSKTIATSCPDHADCTLRIAGDKVEHVTKPGPPPVILPADTAPYERQVAKAIATFTKGASELASRIAAVEGKVDSALKTTEERLTHLVEQRIASVPTDKDAADKADEAINIAGAVAQTVRDFGERYNGIEASVSRLRADLTRELGRVAESVADAVRERPAVKSEPVDLTRVDDALRKLGDDVARQQAAQRFSDESVIKVEASVDKLATQVEQIAARPGYDHAIAEVNTKVDDALAEVRDLAAKVGDVAARVDALVTLLRGSAA
jgi:hypothetical protein